MGETSGAVSGGGGGVVSYLETVTALRRPLTRTILIKNFILSTHFYYIFSFYYG